MIKELSNWCGENVVTVIKYCMAGVQSEGGTFDRQIGIPMSIKDVEGQFTLPIPDAMARDDGLGPKSQTELDAWIKLVTETIYEFWDRSYEGMRFKILSELSVFGLLHPNPAKELRGCLKCDEDKNFFFDVAGDTVKQISLAKFDEWAKNRNASKMAQN